MKKNLATYVAMAAMSTFTGVGIAGAYAQSSGNVIVYGVLDINLRAVKNGDTGTAILQDGGTLNASRIGFKGLEDLGGGMKAGFVLESGFNADTGRQTSQAKLYNRRSTVSLITPYGEIRLGHDNSPSYFNLIMFEPFGGGGVGSYINMFTSGGISSPLHSGATTISRTDNGVGYFLPPNLGGWYGQAQIAPGEGIVGNRHAGARLGYANGPVDIAATYGRTWIANDKHFNIFGLGASYNFG
ncbi:MAG: porin, partial [Glaciimonas sp.]|nr:porin [Glaciimonas sp.]